MLPAQQRLGADDLTLAAVHLRLVEKESNWRLLQRFARRSFSRLARSVTTACICGSKKRKVLRPVALASYMARSARFISSSMPS
jgi:hypothetical protein